MRVAQVHHPVHNAIAVPPKSAAVVLHMGLRAMLRHRGLAALFLLGTLGQGIFQGALVWMLREILLRLSASDGLTISASVGAGLVILAISLSQSFSAFVGEIAAVRLAYRVQIEAMSELLGKVLTLPIRYFEKHSQGDMVMSAYQDLQGVRAATEEAGRTLQYLTRLLGLGTAACLISPKLTLIGLLTIPLTAGPAYWFGQRITGAARQERGSVAVWHDSFLQVSSGIRSIKVNRAEWRVLARANAIGEDVYRYVVQKAQSRGLARFVLEATSGIGLILVLVVGGRDIAAGRLDWQSLMGLLIAVLAVYSPIVSLLYSYSNIRSVIPNLDRVDHILQTPTNIGQSGNMPLHAAPQQIELRDVSFAYDNQSVLDAVSATFRRGETIGIVGPSGAGKSTLLALLLRFYEPTSGAICFDGTDLRDINRADLMDQCAIVLQEPFLFMDSVANNIRLARPDASMDDVMQAAQAANIHDEIMQMEHGYATMLGAGEDARGLSVGQKQRVCIAAALLKNAPILLLDEATSNLDSVAERKVQAAIERLMKGRTTFIIAHRLSTLRDADRIVVLEHGRMVGIGAHDELLRTCPTYQRLWWSQSLHDDAAQPTNDKTVLTNGNGVPKAHPE